MASPQRESDSLDVQLLVDSIPALIHTARPDGYLDYFNKPWLEYLGVTLDKVAGWNWTAVVHPEDVDGIVANWRACLATGEVFEYETRVRSANGEYRWMLHRKVPLRDTNGNIVKWYGSSLDIEERKQAEEKLQRRERDLHSIIKTIPTMVWSAAPDGSVDYFNPRWLDYTDLSPDQSRDWRWTAAIHPDDMSRLTDAWQSILASGEPGEIEARLRRFDGAYRWFLFRANALRDESGKIVKWYGTNVDIEDRKRAEEELRKSEFYLAEGQRLAHMGSWAFDPDGFYYWSPELFRMYGLDPAGKAPSVQEYLDCVHPQDRESMASLIKGVLAKTSPFDATKRIVRPDGEVRYIRCVGVPLVENQSLKKYVGSALDVTEHELLTQDLRRREAYLAEAQRLSHTGSFGWKPDSGEIVWSEETYRIFEYDSTLKPTLDSLVQRVHPDDRALVQQVIQRVSKTGTDFEHEYRLKMLDGRVKHVHAIAHAIQNASDNREFIGAVTDITERTSAEEALRSSEAYLAEAQRLSHTGSWAWSPDTDIRHWSEECYRVLGFDPRDGSPRMEEFIQRIHPDDQPAFRESAKRARHSNLDEEVHYRIVHPGGTVRDIHSIGHPVFSPSGDLIEFTGTVIDITERKKAEEALEVLSRDLQESKAKLEEAQRITHVGYWEWDISTGRVNWSDETYRIYGMQPQERPMDIAACQEKIYPEDWQRGMEEALGSGARFNAECRVIRPTGEVRIAHFQGDVKKDASGQPHQMFGTIQDITDRKRAEDKIREQERELRQILDLVPQVVAVFGPGGERLYANRIGLEYAGLSLEEWRQTPGTFFSVPSFVHPDDRERVARSHSDNARPLGSAYELELRLPKRDGTYRWFLVRFNPLRDEQGKITRWYLAFTDIEDRKQAEDRLRSENVALREEIDKASMFEEIVGTSSALKSVLSRISKVAPSDSTVLITGETGTGKELVARAIHKHSQRSSHAFISVNCAAIPRDLIASELFGHEKGAFTGATQQRLGRFELASGGTLFLDEVGELPAETQIALLRVLQEHEFERVGGSRPIRADVRVIAATNRDLQAAISAGSFRSDLFYRLNVFPIEMPSLRERRADIPLLVEYFIERYARKAGKNITRVNKKTLELLQSYPWPGNIRELQNVIERSVILCETEIFSIDESWLPRQPLPATESKQHLELPRRLETQEKDMIETALKESRGRVFGPTGAAAKLGIPRSTLESKIRSLKIDKNRFRT